MLFRALARTPNEPLRLFCRRFRRHGDREEPIGQGARGSGGAAEQEVASPSCTPTCGGIVVTIISIVIVVIFLLIVFSVVMVVII